MKQKVIVIVVLLLLLLLSGCAVLRRQLPSEAESANPSEADTTTRSGGTEPTDSGTAAPSEAAEPKLAALRQEIVENGFSAGMAFLGFVSEETTENEMRGYLKDSQYAEKYPFLEDAPLVDAGGTELYTVVTAECRASVYSAEMNESGGYDVQTDKALYAGKGADCFLLRCNVSDLYSNVAISIQSGDAVFSVFPMLSGMDGRLAAEHCYDFSMYTEDHRGPEDDAIIAYDILAETDEVQYYTGLGMSLQYTGKTQMIVGHSCWIFALYTEHDDQFVPEFYYGVCDNLIYAYDAISDTWNVLGSG